MPNISIARLSELERKEKELAQMQILRSIAWVGPRLGEALATIQATTPWENWSSRDKQLLHAVCNGATTALALYVDNLPK